MELIHSPPLLMTSLDLRRVVAVVLVLAVLVVCEYCWC
jgi:hypothetical protein